MTVLIVDLFFCAVRKSLGFSVSIELDFGFVWVVENDKKLFVGDRN